MAHWSENTKKLEVRAVRLGSLAQLQGVAHASPSVYLFWLPFPRTNDDAAESESSYVALANFFSRLNEADTVCVLTTPPDAAVLLPYLEAKLQFQLWVAVKATPDAYATPAGSLPNRHAALLVLTKYHGALRHKKTRIAYTYCPACGKTTKDYGGKKHTYHAYGTLISDVWRDIEVNPARNVDDIVNRLCDLFGLDDYNQLKLIDLRECSDLVPATAHDVTAAPIPAYEKENGTRLKSQLVNGDCLAALRTVPDGAIDFCFADPPYNLKKKYDKWDDALESVEYFAWCDKWLSELHRVLKPGRTLAVLNIPLWAVRHYQHLNTIMNFQSWIAWDGLGFPVRMIMPAHYTIICFSKGQPRPLPGLGEASNDHTNEDYLQPLRESYCLRANCVPRRNRLEKTDRSTISDLWHDVHRLKHNSRRVDHPCQLPPLLMRRLFALFTKPNEIILDCFNGAGTSTLVAQQMRRRYIGIELSQQYHELARDRHEQLTCGGDPFGKADTVPTAKNSPVQRVPKQKYAVSKKALQLEVKRIAQELGHLPTRDEVKQLSEYPIEYFERYFVSWGEVCAAARTTGMTETALQMKGEPHDKQGSFTF
ncbi:MAG TPA: DNA methyltransferase [Pyrinomonadaceae bacterium]|jgi:site-specific DNA-methyltransferase (adenine-specific)